MFCLNVCGWVILFYQELSSRNAQWRKPARWWELRTWETGKRGPRPLLLPDAFCLDSSCSSKISKEQLIVPPKALVALAPTASGPARFHPRIFDQQGNFLLETLAKIKILLLHMNVFIMQWALFKMPAWKGRRGKCAWRTSLNKTNKMDDLKKTHPSPKKGVPNGECCLPHLVSNTCALVRTPPDTVRVSDYSS